MQVLEKTMFKEEYDAISNDIYSSFFTSTQLIEEYTLWLKTALLNNSFKTKLQKAHVIKFLAKLQTQKELIELSQNTKKLEEVHRASVSFAKKMK